MGDMADLISDNDFDFDGYGDDYVDYWTNWRPPRCNRCDAVCKWQDTDKGWRLYLHGKPHVCEVKPEDDFEDLGEL